MSVPPLTVQTPRLDLVAATLPHIQAELESRAALEGLLDATITEEWPPGEYDAAALAFFRAQLESGGGALVGWLSWYGVERLDDGRRGRLVATAGFFGPPQEGSVELGFSVVPSARGRGLASEIARELAAWALSRPGVKEVIAHTSDDNVASTRTLLRAGFVRVTPAAATVGDPASGNTGVVRYRRADAPVP